MAFHKSIYFKISVPLILAPIFAFLAIWLVEMLDGKTIGEWSGKLTWVCSAALAPVALAISKFRDLCGMDGLTDIQRANLVTIVRKRTLRFWLASLYLIAVFLLGFAVGVTADTTFGYLVAVSWVTGFFFALYLLALTHFWIDEAEDFKLKVAQQLRDEKERTELVQALRKSQGDKIDPKSDLERYNKVFDSKSGLVQ
nr:hypothetical protein [Dechloromonas sp.]